MAQVKNDSPMSASLKHRLRDIFTPKPRLSSSHIPSTHAPSSSVSLPSRIPIRKKRSFRDVAEDDPDSDTSLNPRARIRQRVDSTSSVATVRGGKSVCRKLSTDSMKTICDLRETKSLKRTPSSLSLSLNPGQAAPARAVLTRTTSHNQSQAPEPPANEKHNILPFPTKRPALFKPPFKAGASDIKGSRAARDVSATADVLRRVYTPRRRRSSQSLAASSLNNDVDIPAGSTASPSPDSPVIAPQVVSLSPEDEMLRQVLEYVVNESEDDDADASQIDAMLSRTPSLSELSTLRSPSSLGISGSSLPEIPDDDNEDELPGPRRGHVPSGPERVFHTRQRSRSHLERFDIKVQPCNKHFAVWDLDSSDVYAWPAWLFITDNHLDYTDIRGPPVKHVDVEFRSTDDTSVQSSPASDYHVRYEGLHLEPDIPRDQIDLIPDDGIAIEDRWVCGPCSDESNSSSRSDTLASFLSDASYATRIFVPVPMSLFKGRECRYFKLRAKVTFAAVGCNVPTTVAYSGTVKVSIEHLRKEVHMDGRRASLDM